MKVVYLAHPVSGDVPGNLAEARAWIRWLYDNVPGIAIVATWITEVEVLDEGNPEHRKLGLQHDAVVVARCDAILLVGPRLSPGMMAEMIAAEKEGLRILNFIGCERVPATADLIRKKLLWCDWPKCASPIAHMDRYYNRTRAWCETHTPWSGHDEDCPDPCSRLLADAGVIP